MKTINTPVVNPYSRAERLALSGRYDDRALRAMLLDHRMVRTIWWGVCGVSVLALFSLLLGMDSGQAQALYATLALFLSVSFLYHNNQYQAVQYIEQSPLQYNSLQHLSESEAMGLIRSIARGGTQYVRGSLWVYLSHAGVMLTASALIKSQSLPFPVQVFIVSLPLLLWLVLWCFLRENGRHIMQCVELASDD